MGLLIGLLTGGQHVLDLLGVPSGQAYEDDYSGIADDEVKGAAVHEQVHYRGDNQADEGHEQYLAYRREIGLRGVADERHHTEGAGGDEKHFGNRGLGEGGWRW